MGKVLDKIRAKYVTTIDEAELACRILEAAGEVKRPPGLTAQQALDTMDKVDKNTGRRAARAAMKYWNECIMASNQTN